MYDMYPISGRTELLFYFKKKCTLVEEFKSVSPTNPKDPLPRPFVFSFYVTLISVHLIKGVKHLWTLHIAYLAWFDSCWEIICRLSHVSRDEADLLFCKWWYRFTCWMTCVLRNWVNLRQSTQLLPYYLKSVTIWMNVLELSLGAKFPT